MATGLTPFTELEAINEILATGSESPVSTLDENTVIDASLAMNTLRATSVEVQTRGWNFNTENNLVIAPDQDGTVVLPRNTLGVDTVGETASINAVQRGLRLYNETDKTYVWTAAPTVTLVVALAFEELPSTARLYITIRAARKYQDRYFGDTASHSYSAADESEAKSTMMDEELRSTGPNMLNSQFARDLQSRV
ncbi:hypothetical protein [Mesorhizobium sp. M0244]|uniref:hypothetical protein n=1 Tax=Mesorhizobium sp. M0244 TaxID=2956926 RepID=UPI00333B101F